ncbi:MAG: response regulator transcription factor [Cyclobacteriaceae bacterium]|nr:response regulator transcription factor [Cyclobacteriaceae bacterium]
MNVLIIEDEHLAASKLEKMLSEIDHEIQVMARLESVLDSINWLNENEKPDLIFMDIQLDDGICFEIFDSVKIETPIIFTTAYDEYAIKAFQVNSVDYLLKPIEEQALSKALGKYKSIYQVNQFQNDKLNILYDQIIQNYKTRFFVKIGNHFHSVSVDEIQCFLIQERGTFLRTFNGKKYDLDYSLDQLQKLVDPNKFFRINRNYFIHIDSIQDIYGYSSNRLGVKLKMLDHLDMIVSREKVADFKKWLDR